MRFHVTPARTQDPLSPASSSPVLQPSVSEVPVTPDTPTPTRDNNSVQTQRMYNLIQGPQFAEKTPPQPVTRTQDEPLGYGVSLQGRQTVNRFKARHMGTPRDTASTDIQPLDYALGKMVTENNPEKLAELANTLSSLRGRLQNQGSSSATPLSREEILRYNAILKPFGLMTEGQNLFNLSVEPAQSSEQGPPQPVRCSDAEIGELVEATVQMQRQKGGETSPGFFQTAPRPSFSRPGLLPFQGGESPASVRFGNPRPGPAATSSSGPVSALLGGVTETNFSGIVQAYSINQSVLGPALERVDKASELVERLIPQQQATDSALEIAVTQTDLLQNQVQMAGLQLTDLTSLGTHLLSAPDLSQVLGGDLGAPNQTLAALGLEIKRAPDGAVSFVQRGQVISEPAFRTALATGIAQKQVQVERLSAELENSEATVTHLSDKSASISADLHSASSDLAAGLQEVTQVRERIVQNQADLQALRNDPVRWNQLSPAEQQQAEAMLAGNQTSLKRIEKTEQRGRNTLQQAQTQLANSEKVREKAAHTLSKSAQIRLLLNQALTGANQLLNRFRELLDRQRAGDERVKALIQAADELERTLHLTPGPDLSALGSLSEDWLNTVAETAREFQDLHSGADSAQASQREYFERGARMLRDNLDRHEQVLNSKGQASREALLSALHSSLEASRAFLAEATA